jgi:ring-1,2-phenylacetyl-CoA epoxidase subunit PaaE
MSSSTHTDSSVAVTIKRVKGGIVSNYLNDKVSKGDFLEVLEPMGNFYFEPQEVSKRNIVLIGAGSGITPLMSIAKSVLKTEENTKVLLVYGNRNEDTIIFRKELSELENTYRDRLEIVHVLSQSASNWVGNKGRINQANLIIFLKNWGVNFLNDHFYMCGPVEMMEECKKMFSLFEVPDSNIFSEKFNSPAVFEELSQNTGNELVQRLVTINYDNNTYELKVEPHQSILEAALEQDIDLPYSCQAGMCTACMGKCVSGKILMDEEDGLTEK